MRHLGPFSQSRLGIPAIVGQSWRRHAVWSLLLVLVLLASAPVQAQQPTITITQDDPLPLSIRSIRSIVAF